MKYNKNARSIENFAANFYSDAVEWEKMINILIKERWSKNEQNTFVSTPKLLSMSVMSLETMLKSLYILCNCKIFSKENIQRTYKELITIGHNLLNLYDLLKDEWKILDNKEEQFLSWIPEKAVSVRYNLESYYKYNLSDRAHSIDSYLDQHALKEFMKISINNSDEDNFEKLILLESEYSVRRKSFIDNKLKIYAHIMKKFKKLFIDNTFWWTIPVEDDFKQDNVFILLDEQEHNLLSKALFKDSHNITPINKLKWDYKISS